MSVGTVTYRYGSSVGSVKYGSIIIYYTFKNLIIKLKYIIYVMHE